MIIGIWFVIQMYEYVHAFLNNSPNFLDADLYFFYLGN